jgi:hypothetical protein
LHQSLSQEKSCCKFPRFTTLLSNSQLVGKEKEKEKVFAFRRGKRKSAVGCEHFYTLLEKKILSLLCGGDIHTQFLKVKMASLHSPSPSFIVVIIIKSIFERNFFSLYGGVARKIASKVFSPQQKKRMGEREREKSEAKKMNIKEMWNRNSRN